MKKHISITITPETFDLARRMAAEEQRSVSQVFERSVRIAAERGRMDSPEELLPASAASFSGSVARADAYGDRV